MEYTQGFRVLCVVVVVISVFMDTSKVCTHISHGYFLGIRTVIWLCPSASAVVLTNMGKIDRY